MMDQKSPTELSLDAEEGSGFGASAQEPRRRGLRRIMEPLAIIIMVIGYVMIFQFFTITLYTYSYTIMLVGTLLFIIASHLPE